MPRQRCQPDVAAEERGDRCTGRCCRAFHLPWSKEEWAGWLATGQVPEEYRAIDAEIAMIVAMVRPHPELSDRWTCILFGGESCQAYDARPNMCRMYPYDQPCEHGLLCASAEARAGRVGYRRHLPVLD